MDRPLIEQLRERFGKTSEVAEALERVRGGGRIARVSHMRGGSGALLAAILREELRRPILLVTSTLERAEALADGLSFFGAGALLFPALDTLPYEEAEPPLPIASARSLVLDALARIEPGASSADPPLIVAPADALMLRLLPREELLQSILGFEWGQRLDLDAVALQLAGMGYRREAMAESPGEFALRGSILDVYPTDAETPWRVDCFGDEIESIRAYDPATQRSLPGSGDTERLTIRSRALLAPARDYLQGGGRLARFFDLLPPDALVILEGPSRIRQRFEYHDEIAARHWKEIESGKGEQKSFFIENGVPAKDWALDAREALSAVETFQRMEWLELSVEGDEGEKAPLPAVAIGAQSLESIPSSFGPFLDLIQEKRFSQYRVAIVCDNAGQARRLDELLAEHQVPAVVLGEEGAAEASLGAQDVAILVGDLHEGFVHPASRLLVITDREMFGRYKRRRIYRKAYHGKPVADPSQIHRGDYVVHSDHGIGQFVGIRRQGIEDRIAEFLEIVYQDGDKLLVPLEKLHYVQKYASAEGKVPALDRLGKKGWSRRRAASREAIRKLAGELLELYARREAAQGEPCGRDTVWQQEFEASFLHQETPDQLRAIQETKADMERDRPMDRLVCGDVGYGKTEVAIRAAFKALNEGRQVAILAPTTLLVQQHYNTFRERLADYPFKVGILSRFSTAAEQKKTLAGLAIGEIQLIVGTHRMLSKDVKFQRLGLLVVDEEQRFGVAQKEKIKSLRASVHILTLTATPIPRTLHMALAKLRDLSIIQTPPADRLPIKTRTIHFEKDLIEEAILRELNRGGQVFFVHNRIETIDEVADSVRQVVPKARIAVAHGQMDADELENIMIEFIAGRFDILISTTIIENGIDIPNVNTILVNRADAMGLAQLYQLRGRVGRDVRQAYAYLILPQGRPITDSAVKRLAALEEFTELGMGFSIAMRDMEIRGTGNILGAEQHGAISDIGFEMYCKLLEEAVLDLRGEPPPEPLWPVDLKWPVDQWIPEEYMPIESQRIRAYKDLAQARDAHQIELVREELTDRYGALPKEAVNLINAARVRIALAPWQVDQVRPGAEGSVRINGRSHVRQLAESLESLAAETDWIARTERRADGSIHLHLENKKEKSEEVLGYLAAILGELEAPAAELTETSALPS